MQSKKWKVKPMSDAQIVEAARLFAALAEPARLKLLRALMGEDLTVKELMVATGLKQGTASKHLGILAANGFVRGEREGGAIRYRIRDQHLGALCGLVCERMAEEARERARDLKAG